MRIASPCIAEPTGNKVDEVNKSLTQAPTVDKTQLKVVEELNSLLSTKLNLDDSVLSSVKERVQRASGHY